MSEPKTSSEQEKWVAAALPSPVFDEDAWRKLIPGGYVPGSKEYRIYEKLIPVLKARGPSDRPRIVVVTDIEQDYDDLLAIIFLSEMHRLGAVELAGFIANHGASLERAKFLRTVVHLLGLAHIPVAQGTNGYGDPAELAEENKHWEIGSYYELKNITFAEKEWNRDPFLPGCELLEKLALEVDTKGKEPLTVLLISSLQDISEYFDSKLGPRKAPEPPPESVPEQASIDAAKDSKDGGSDSKDSAKRPEAVIEPIPTRADAKREEEGAKFLKKHFKKFVSQGGYTVTSTPDGPDPWKIEPLANMANNAWNFEGAKNYTQCLAKYGLPSDTWSREVAKVAILDGSAITKLAGLGPIGAHLRWLYRRQEFKFYWDPYNAPFMQRLNPEWYLQTRLVLTPGSDEYVRLQEPTPGFEEVLPLAKVIAYDGCAAMGAVGDDVMRALGIMSAELPRYNTESPHRVFGTKVGDLGGIDGHSLSRIFEVFLIGALKATQDEAEWLIHSSSVKHAHETYAVGLDVFEFQKPFLKESKRLAEVVRFGKDPKEVEKSKEALKKLKSEQLDGPGELSKYPKVPAPGEIPYELLYQAADPDRRKSATQNGGG